MTVLAVFVAFYAFAFLFVPQMGDPAIRERFFELPWAGFTHVFGGGIALLLGPFQFLGSIRKRRMNLHRWMGRIYLLAVLSAGLAGLYLATVTSGGFSARVGFGALASLWLLSGSSAYIWIKRGKNALHRKWMIRNYSLTYAAVSLRFLLPAMMMNGLEFQAAYQAIAWLCWVPNLVFAEWVILRKG